MAARPQNVSHRLRILILARPLCQLFTSPFSDRASFEIDFGPEARGVLTGACEHHRQILREPAENYQLFDIIWPLTVTTQQCSAKTGVRLTTHVTQTTLSILN